MRGATAASDRISHAAGILRLQRTEVNFAMKLSNSQIRHLRGLCHSLDPVVMVADKGLSDNVRAEVELALDSHELIKIKLRSEREQRKAWTEDLVDSTGATLVQQIGQVICLYRRHPENPRIALPR
jgi:RNA-binding protein